MKKVNKLIISLSITIVMLYAGCKKDTGEQVITVMTYNVAGLPEGISSSHPALYTSSIGPLLNDVNIVHAQEDFCYHDSLLLGAKHVYQTETMGCVPNGDGLNTFSAFPISNVKRFAWTDCTGFDCYTPKGFSYSQITLKGGVVVDFYNIHCNAGGSEASMEARRGNIRQICEYITANSAGMPAIIMGDFNCRYTRDGDSIRAFSDLDFKDVWVELIRNGSVPALSNDKLDDCSLPDRTKADCERVDKILYRSSDKVTITPIYYKLDDSRYYYQGDNTQDLSDHWPVFANFIVKEK